MLYVEFFSPQTCVCLDLNARCQRLMGGARRLSWQFKDESPLPAVSVLLSANQGKTVVVFLGWEERRDVCVWSRL